MILLPDSVPLGSRNFRLADHVLPLVEADGRSIDAGSDVVVLAGDIDECFNHHRLLEPIGSFPPTTGRTSVL